jgi:hypothetical protein
MNRVHGFAVDYYKGLLLPFKSTTRYVFVCSIAGANLVYSKGIFSKEIGSWLMA